jgi:sulfur-carrier protein adenylyltransferase/sulfurtransferase
MSVREVGIAEAMRLREEGYRFVDVREPFEWDAGHIAGATHIPLAEVPARIGAELPDRDAPLVLYCRSGARSGRAAAFLDSQGYTDVVNMAALVDDWEAGAGAWEGPPQALTDEQQGRYARQILIPEVGVDGQRRLLEARVLLIGAGGLGSPVALYLAAAGIGTLGIVDDDVVEESNLQRQVLHRADAVGSAKVDSAERAVRALNAATAVVKHAERLDADNVDRLIAGYDVIVDGSDSLDTRYVLNDAAVRRRTPVVHGSVYRWEGVVTTLVPFEGPCYRCLYPTRPPDELVPACDVAGVLGVLPGIVGTLQAAEALKLVLGVGTPLAGRILMVDAQAATFSEVTAPRDPACAACGEPAAVARA